ncbi:MAG: spermatid nuclear transition protein 1 family protein [Paraprevotella clara]|nr:spermatid nuclear transition protein 1 family protein [Paraprevotella clara]
MRGPRHSRENGFSFCAKRKINLRRLKNRLAQNFFPISAVSSELWCEGFSSVSEILG